MGYFALKADMAKAYDRVEWRFLCGMMRRLGFNEKWIKLIFHCISTVQYSICINGKVVGNIRPSRGLRQGDPLSPFLFLLCAEGLSALFKHECSVGGLKGLQCGRAGPMVSHLLFADDSFFFMEATTNSCARFREVMGWYEKASGQLVNLHKSSVCFSPHLGQVVETELASTLGVNKVPCHEKYLGLPCFAGRSKASLFQSFRDRIWNKLFGWKSKLFSVGGREVFLKSVIQAIPTYVMNLFRLPDKLIQEIHRLCARFWWGGDDTRRKMHWCSWERLCWHKVDGGMGFRDLTTFNKALLAKQAWRILQWPTSLAARVMKGIYFPCGDFLNVKSTNRSSYIWRSILWGRELLLEGSRWAVGNGNKIDIRKDSWIPKKNPACTYSFKGQTGISMVCDLKTETGCWNSELLDSLFSAEEAGQIMSIPISLHDEDHLIWHFNSSGDYSVKSGYWNAIRIKGWGQVSTSAGHSPWWRSLWQLSIPSKVKIFIWRACLNWIPTQFNLMKHGVPTSQHCPLCNLADESTIHALWNCSRLKDIKKKFPHASLPMVSAFPDFYTFVGECWDFLSKDEVEILLLVFWRIWHRRNKYVHDHITLDDRLVLEWALDFHSRYKEANSNPITSSPSRGLSDIRERAPVLHDRWDPPPAGCVKLNVDAGLAVDSRRVGCGAVVRDHMGGFLASSSIPIEALISPPVAEALAVLQGLILCSRLGFNNVIVESDCQRLCKVLTNRTPLYAEFGFVISDILLLCDKLKIVGFNYCKRTNNEIAHGLARIALSIDNSIIWWPGLPHCLYP